MAQPRRSAAGQGGALGRQEGLAAAHPVPALRRAAPAGPRRLRPSAGWPASSRAARAAGQVEPLDDRGVGEPEQVQPVGRLDADGTPGRHGDHVAAGDLGALAAELEGTGAVEHLPDRRAHLPPRGGPGAPRDTVHLGPHRDQCIPAGGGVGEADGRMARPHGARMALRFELQLRAERRVGELPPVGAQR